MYLQYGGISLLSFTSSAINLVNSNYTGRKAVI